MCLCGGRSREKTPPPWLLWDGAALGRGGQTRRDPQRAAPTPAQERAAWQVNVHTSPAGSGAWAMPLPSLWG